MRRNVRISLLALATAVAIALAAVLVAPGAALAQDDQQDARTDLLEYEQNTIDIAADIGDSVVAIIVTVEGEAAIPEGVPQQYRQFFQERQFRQGAGSGFVVNDEGQILTNLHVVQSALEQGEATMLDNATITVNFPDVAEDLPVRVVGVNPDYDLALLELEDPDQMPEGALAIPFAEPETTQVGEKAIAIGNPFRLQSTVTHGIVSAIERERPGAYGLDIPFVQTDAAINPGNSGGPLLNSRGEVIGVNNAILTPSGGFAGVGFAVPVSLVQESLAGLQEGGVSGLVGALDDPNRPVLGIAAALSVDDYPQALRNELRLPDAGAVVTGVTAGSPAAEAGLQSPKFTASFQGQQFPAGVDVITAIGGEPVTDVRDLQRYLVENTEPGDTVTLDVFRDGETMQVDVTLTSAEDLSQD
jgi:S1-C subfamily serine protease